MKKKVNENCLPAFSLQNSSVSAHPIEKSSVLTSALGQLPVESILKSRPACMLKGPGMNTSVTKKAPMTAKNTSSKHFHHLEHIITPKTFENII